MKKRVIKVFLTMFVLLSLMTGSVISTQAANYLPAPENAQTPKVQAEKALYEEPSPSGEVIPYAMIIVSVIMIGFTALREYDHEE